MQKKSVTIAMAIYKPNIQWLEEQLISLNNQTYDNLKLLIWNDFPEDNSNLENIVSKLITKFPFKLIQSKKNFGSNGAFANLTRLVNTDYIAYCDQDDIWLPEKIEILVKEIQNNNADLICSDMYVIDSNSNIIANQIKVVRPRYVFYEQEEGFIGALVHNWVTGCTSLIKTDIAKRALPFPEEFVHDAWLAMYVSAYGKIKNLKIPLIKYRIHGTNQTTVLIGINTKKDYFEKRILGFEKKVNIAKKVFIELNYQRKLNKLSNFIAKRNNYYNNPNFKSFYELLKLRYIHRPTVFFELCLPFMPEFIFRFLVKQIRKGRI